MGYLTLLGAGKPPVVAASFNFWDSAKKPGTVTLSNSDLTASTGTTANQTLMAKFGASSGKYYYEVTLTSMIGNQQCFGVASASHSMSLFVGNFDAAGDYGAGHFRGGEIYFQGGNQLSTGVSLAQGDVVGIAVDLDNLKFWSRKNGGDWLGNSASHSPATNTGGVSLSGLDGLPWYPAMTVDVVGDSFTANFGGTAYGTSAPSGFSNWPGA